MGAATRGGPLFLPPVIPIPPVAVVFQGYSDTSFYLATSQKRPVVLSILPLIFVSQQGCTMYIFLLCFFLKLLIL